MTLSPSQLQSRLFFPLGQLLNVQVEVQGALALFDRIFEYLDLPIEISDAPDAVTLKPDAVQGRIRFRQVSFRYGTPPGAALAAETANSDAATNGAGPADGAQPRMGAAARPAILQRRIGAEAMAERARADAAAADMDAADAAAISKRGPTPWLQQQPKPEMATRSLTSCCPLAGSDCHSGLEDLDFEAEPGQLVALVRPSGSGRRRPPTCCRASTTWTRARSRSMASTFADRTGEPGPGHPGS